MLTEQEILKWLREKDPQMIRTLIESADRLRHEKVGDAVHFRGLIELSSWCRRNCLYCGIRSSRPGLVRYRMTREEVLESAEIACRFGYGTVVLQAAEDPGISEEFISEVIREIKKRFDMAVTLSLGERKKDEWIRWKAAGADRYLLRFETSNQRLFEAIHPKAPDTVYPNRFELLKQLREIGYEVGSGVMIGIPGQNMSDLAHDIKLFQELDLDMIGCGPFLAHPATPLGSFTGDLAADDQIRSKYRLPEADEQTESSNEMAFKVIALTRLVCPESNIPSTTAVATLDGEHGRVSGLSSGANVIMPNLTPTRYRALYEIYPNKAATFETAEQTHQTALEQIRSIGRSFGQGHGSRRRLIN